MIAAGLSSFTNAYHHQKFDVKWHPQKAQGTTRKLRAKDRPQINDFVSEAEFERLLDVWFGNAARVLTGYRPRSQVRRVPVVL